MADAALPLREARRRLKTGDVTSEVLVRQALRRIVEQDGALHAFTRIDAENALAEARTADAEMAEGRDRGAMHGIPYALKDIYDVAGWPTTCGSRLRLDHRAAEDSEVARRFRAAGAVLLGKLDTFEFALGGPSFDLPFPPARNPWDPERLPGGSSSGSAAAVAAGYVAVAPGSCTTGSIRGPAAWCGVVGLKPSFGRVSRRGVFPLAGSLDHCGPLARTVEDAAIALTVMAGHDPDDPESADVPTADYLSSLEAGARGVRIGVPRAFFAGSPQLSTDALEGINRTLGRLAEMGAEVRDISLPDYALFAACARVLMTAEAFAIHRDDLRRHFDTYGAVAARRFSIGAAISAADYFDALELKRQLTARVDAALETCDLLLTAISLDTAPRFDGTDAASAWPLQSVPFNVTGHPAISVPVGLARNGLPLAVQIAGRRFDEALVLRAARAVERATGWEKVPLPR